MEAYTDFARVYDELMDETPYTEWSLFLVSRLRECGIMDGLVLDLGCGTGNMTELLYVAGYDMIGVDASADMLEQAVRKKEEARIDVLYLMQEMEAFELYGTVRAVVCCCDCVNYLTEPEALLRCFQLVNNYLGPDGVFYLILIRYINTATRSGIRLLRKIVTTAALSGKILMMRTAA